jgi:oxalate decarboxylase/phosphoglucose isomerase-like protein (cupin superfamily)
MRTHNHVHPPSLIAGKVRIHQVRGEGNDEALMTELEAGEAGYVQQGALHVVENLSRGHTRFLVFFDHPQAGTVFAFPSLLGLPRRLINSAFTDDVLRRDNEAIKGVFLPIRGCKY